jgi:hypothetical protein
MDGRSASRNIAGIDMHGVVIESVALVDDD